MNRHACRILIVRTLYEIEIRKITSLDEELLFELINFAFDPTLEDGQYSFQEDDEDYLYVKDVIQYIFSNLDKIDLIISKGLENYTISRLNYVDRAIIRLAVYEMINTELPKTIIINEALEITKEYSNLDDGLQAKFNNKLLDKISQGFKNE